LNPWSFLSVDIEALHDDNVSPGTRPGCLSRLRRGFQPEKNSAGLRSECHFGVGPALAHRLSQEFGSIERVVTADEEALMRVRGLGRQTAAQIRELLG
jgi:hypothetical protein